MAIETTDKATTAASASQNSLDTTNTSIENKINQMYDAQLASQKAQLEGNYNTNLTNINAEEAKLGDVYQGQKNELATQYERNKRNQNMQAAAAGLNTGANTQMNLSQGNAYLSAYNDLGKQEAQARENYSTQRLTLQQQYQSDVAQAVADGDAQRAAALLDEYNNQRTNAMNQASTLAQYGDFSMYESLYGTATAQMMQRGWAMQNPDIAWSMGYLTAAEYKALTGVDPKLMSGNIDENGYFTGQNSINNQNQSSGGGYGGYGGYPDTNYKILVDGVLTDATYDTNSGVYKYTDANNNVATAASTNVVTKKP